jgi:hypothetical protein
MLIFSTRIYFLKFKEPEFVEENSEFSGIIYSSKLKK